MLIQNVDFKPDEVIISVGFFLAHEVVDLCRVCPPKRLSAYEPRLSVVKQYQKIKYPGLSPIYGAVLNQDGHVRLHTASTRTTVHIDPDGDVVCYDILEIVKDTFVDWGRIDKLLLNCEGSEYAILDRLDQETSSLCNVIFVQFHHFLDNEFTINDTHTRLEQLGRTHNCVCLHHKYYKYLFERK